MLPFRQLVSLFCIFILVALIKPLSAQGGNSAELCSQGLNMIFAVRWDEAKPLLMQGFAARNDGFIDDKTLGNCAMWLGDLYNTDQEFPAAIEAYEVAMPLLEKTQPQPIFELFFTYASYGTVNKNLGYFNPARRAYGQALNILDKYPELEDFVEIQEKHAEILVSLSDAQSQLGLLDDAQANAEAALTVAQKLSYGFVQGQAYAELGNIAEDRGQYGEAIQRYQQAQAVFDTISDLDSELINAALANNIGLVFIAQGRYEEARELIFEAVNVFEASAYPATEAMINLAVTYSEEGDNESALEWLDQAAIVAEVLNDQSEWETIYNNRGLEYAGLGDYPAAQADFQAALDINQSTGGFLARAGTLHNIGFVYFEQGFYDQALQAFQEALTLFNQYGDEDNAALTLGSIGSIYLELGDQEAALDYLEQAIEKLERVRAGAGSELGRSGFISQFAGIYDAAVRLHFELGNDEQAFKLSEQGRARAFFDSINTGVVDFSDETAHQLYTAVQQANIEFQNVATALAKVQAECPDDIELITELEAQLAQLELRYQNALMASEQYGNQLLSLVARRSPEALPTLDEIQKHLSPNTTLVSYHLVNQNEGMVFVIQDDSFVVERLDVGSTKVRSLVENFRAFGTLDPHPEEALQLYSFLIDPIIDYLDTEHLIIIPHDQLHYMPFAAFSDGSRYLSDKFVISTLPSASVLPLLMVADLSTITTPLILGNPTQDLPGAEKEALEIADLYGIEAVVHGAATETTLRNRSAESTIIHIAAHGQLNAINPLRSKLVLAEDEAQDGDLLIDEIYTLDLAKSNLVVLSACETQIAESVSPGDDMVALSRAFMFAGSEAILASLWPVDDEATQLLMVQFHQNLISGMGAAQALQKAQHHLRTTYPEYNNPLYWAGFVLIGDGLNTLSSEPNATQTVTSGPIPDKPQLNLERLVIVGLIVAIIVASIVFVWQLYKLYISKRQ